MTAALKTDTAASQIKAAALQVVVATLQIEADLQLAVTTLPTDAAASQPEEAAAASVCKVAGTRHYQLQGRRISL